ncbi:MAG: helix-turn-helix transcriptional regulator [Lactobacillus sp.]|uniref:AraC family transcriptional regulator n=1 Tax=Bombilactobacillus bombi TaxID=1303590 RepID=UPI0035E79C83|nr:helix-turn-helix transcriptional regulator [Lactobacillus sp.]
MNDNQVAYHEKQIYNNYLPIRVIFHKNNPKMFVAPHWHYGIEVLYVEKGSPGFCYISGNKFKLKENNLLIIGSSSIHRLELSITDNDKLLTLIIPPNWLFYIKQGQQLFFTFDSISVNLDVNNTEYTILKSKIKEMIKISCNKNIVWKQKLKLLSNSYFLASILIEIIMNSDKRQLKEKVSVPKDIEKILLYFNKNYNKPLKIFTIANNFNFSPEYFSRYFKNYVGISPKKFLLQLRLSKAALLLRNSDKSIDYIIESTGFSHKNFYVSFKKYYNMTPLEYRNFVDG